MVNKNTLETLLIHTLETLYPIFVHPLVLGETFLKYMDSFKAYLLASLQNVNEVEVKKKKKNCCVPCTKIACLQVCLAGFGIVGDLCRNLSKLIEPYCAEICQAMFNVLSVSSLIPRGDDDEEYITYSLLRLHLPIAHSNLQFYQLWVIWH